MQVSSNNIPVAYVRYYKTIVDIIQFMFLIDSLLALLENKSFSPAGSTANVKEQNTYMFFKDLLEEIERKLCVFESL